MNFDLLKNPIIIGILSAVGTYLYLSWDAERKYKKNPNIPKKKINFITPAIIGVIIWFLSSCYFDPSCVGVSSGNGNNLMNSPMQSQQLLPLPQRIPRYKLIESANGLSESYHLIGKNNIRLPQTDVFIDLAQF